MLHRIILALSVLPAFCSAQVTLVSRHSEAQERHYGSNPGGSYEHYNNLAAFDGVGDWAGTLPQGGGYESSADATRVGGRFATGGRRLTGQSSFEERWTRSEMTVRIDVGDLALLSIAFDALGQGPEGPNTDRLINSRFDITSVQTGEVVFSMWRDGISRYVGIGVYAWDRQTTSLELARGTYDIVMSSSPLYWAGGHAGIYNTGGNLSVDMDITSVPTPGSLAAFGFVAITATRRRRHSRIALP